MRARQVLSGGQQSVGWAHAAAAGVSEQGEDGAAAYDPLGNYVRHSPPEPQRVQPPSYYGA